MNPALIKFIVILGVIYAILEPRFRRSMECGLMRRLMDPPVDPKTGWQHQNAMHPGLRYVVMVLLAVGLTIIVENPESWRTVAGLGAFVGLIGLYVVLANGFGKNGNICPDCHMWRPYSMNQSKCSGCDYKPHAVKAEAS